MSEHFLNPATEMDALTLHVGDLENMTDYYAEALALSPIEETVRRAGHSETVHRVLGRGDKALIKLVGTPGLPAVDPRQAGLFHTAFLFDSKAALAATVYRTAQDSRSVFAGSSDHLVSEAFYFTDPEGNGIELYVDRPRDEWRRDAAGGLMMDTLWLDPNLFLQQHLDEKVLENLADHPGKIGHMHLQVGDIALARSFYVDALGFEASVADLPGALFAAAGGYHHHLGLNTWNSRGAGPRAASLGLADVAVTVPERADLDALIARLRQHGFDFQDSGSRIRALDPWGTQVTVAIGASGVDELLAR